MPPKIRDYLKAISQILDRAQSASSVSAHKSAVRNPDRSVDGEIRFIVGDRDARDLLIDVEDWIGRVPSNIWISAGVRFKVGQETIDQYKGKSPEIRQRMLTIGAYAQRGRLKVKHRDGTRATVPSKGYNFSKARSLASEFPKQIGHEAQEVFVRLAYNPDDTQPAWFKKPATKKGKKSARKATHKKAKATTWKARAKSKTKPVRKKLRKKGGTRNARARHK